MWLELDSYELGSTGYQKGQKEVTNFLASLEEISLQVSEGERIYILKILVDGNKEYLLDVPAKLLNSRGICSQIPTAVYVENIKEFDRSFKRTLVSVTKDMAISKYILNRPSFNNVEGNVVFCFSNGAITKEGFDSRIYTNVDGYYFSGDAMNDEEFQSQAGLFMDIMLPCMESMYPVFLMNIMSVLSEPLRQWGVKTDLTLWLDGNSGSGKTSLAIAAGTFTNRDSYGGKRVVSSTEKISHVVTALAESCGIPVIFDDVKYEKTQRQREKSTVSIDIVLRSIYQGRATEKLPKSVPYTGDVYTCAIVTGEYMETQESQNARLLYLNISEFVQDEKSRYALSQIQKHSRLIGTIVGRFIMWWIIQEEENQLQKKWQYIYQQMREEKWLYDTLKNGQRLKDNRAGLIFATRIFKQFVNDSIKMEGDKQKYFFEQAERSIDLAVKNTFNLLQGMDGVVRQAMKEVLDNAVEECQMRIANYCVDRYGNDHQEKFCLLHDWDTDWEDTFVWINETKKSLQDRETDILIADDYPSLIIKRDTLMDLIFRRLEGYIKEGRISQYDVDKISLPYLAKMKLIYSFPRSEGGVRGEKKYPLLVVEHRVQKYMEDIYQIEGIREVDHYELEEVPVVQCNLDDSIYERIMEMCIYSEDRGPKYKMMDEDIRKEVIRSRKKALSKRYLCPKNKGGR